jgi:hypothetical protein
MRTLSLLFLLLTAGHATAAPDTLLARLKKKAGTLQGASIGSSETRLAELPLAKLEKLRRGPRLTEADYELSPEAATRQINKMGIRARVTDDHYVVFDHPEEPSDHNGSRKREPWLAMARARELLGAEPMTREEAIAKLKVLGLEAQAARHEPDYVYVENMRVYTNMGAGWSTGPVGDFLATAQRKAWEQKLVMTFENTRILGQVRALGFQADLFYGASLINSSGRSHTREEMAYQHLRGVRVSMHAGDPREAMEVPVADALPYARAWSKLHRPPMTEEYRPPLQITSRDRKMIDAVRRHGFEVSLLETDEGIRAVIRALGGARDWTLPVALGQLGRTAELWMKLHRPPTHDELNAALPAAAVKTMIARRIGAP